ncbi:MAG TPA: MepB family protein [Candidatus Babeliales bacterium]|nr:MepB family protein [Candidatus Babeliales bacterium]
MQLHTSIHPDLLTAESLAYKTIGLSYSNYKQETESQEYGACGFELNNKHIKFRVAKITPTKIGQFVTFWKRINNGPIMPYDMSDSFDLLIISVRNQQHFGQFIFPKNILRQKGLLSQNNSGGKRAMRVYPPWDITDNPQAKKTQAWQLHYFVEIQPNFDIILMQQLVSNE